MKAAMETAVELMSFDGEVCVAREDGSFSIYEQIVSNDKGFLPLEDGVYKYDGTGAGQTVPYAEFVADVTENGVEEDHRETFATRPLQLKRQFQRSDHLIALARPSFDQPL